jgi:hypothetical protein
MLSSFEGHPVEIPFDEDLYERRLSDLIATSRFTKPAAESDTVSDDVNQSFN